MRRVILEEFTEAQTEYLPTLLLLCTGAPYVLKKNMRDRRHLGLNNGTSGFITEIVPHPMEPAFDPDPAKIPEPHFLRYQPTVVFKLRDSKRVKHQRLEGFASDEVPVSPYTGNGFSYPKPQRGTRRTATIRRTQLPLTSEWARTTWQAQGGTYCPAVLYLDEKTHAHLYVQLSRGVTMDDIVILADFDELRIKSLTPDPNAMKELERLERAEHSCLTTWAEKNPDFVNKHGVKHKPSGDANATHQGQDVNVFTDEYGAQGTWNQPDPDIVELQKQLEKEHNMRRPKKRWVGLMNEGLTCYVSSVIQSMHAASEFRAWICKHGRRPSRDKEWCGAPLANLMENMMTTADSSLSTGELMAHIRRHTHLFPLNTTGDALEIQRTILGDPKTMMPWTAGDSNPYHALANEMPFEGSTGNVMTCQVCGESWKTARTEELNHIIVPIVACQNLPRTEQTAIGDGTTEVTSLQALVKHMFSPDTVEYKHGCVTSDDGVAAETGARKTLTISKPPSLLCLGIKRHLRNDRGDWIINAAPITHPRLIDIGGFHYNLYAVVLHRQAAEKAEAHYVALCRDTAEESGNKYYMCDDSRVTPATLEEYDEHKTVHRAAALYYKLVGPVPEDHGGS